MIKRGKLYLITGGSGFLGIHLIERILNKGGKVRIMARDEGNIMIAKKRFSDIEIFPADVRDEFEVKQAMKGVSGVFHLAASKHVLLAEKFVKESVKTNVIGSMNIFEQSLNQNLDFVLSVSTDKAAQIAGVYGATKLLMERLSIQYEKLNPNCEYRVVRYGNVLYSTGSVLCKWKELIQNDGEVLITDPNATRFFWTVEQAIDLIFDCLEKSKDSTPYYPTMKSMNMGNLLTAMIEKYGEGRDVNVKEIGLQEGENLHEKILEDGPYSNETPQFTIDEIKELI